MTAKSVKSSLTKINPLAGLPAWGQLASYVGVPGMLALALIFKPHIGVGKDVDLSPVMHAQEALQQEFRGHSVAVAVESDSIKQAVERLIRLQESELRVARASCMNTANLAKDKEAALRECLR